MRSTIGNDDRIDPRIRSRFANLETFDLPSVSSREEALAVMNAGGGEMIMPSVTEEDYVKIAPSDGLKILTEKIVSNPDGNTINLQIILPQSAEPLACVYYLHGGGMMFNSCYDANYRAWGRLVAEQSVAVVMPDFRNCLFPCSTPETAPFPAGLNDCVSGLRWLHEHAGELGIDPNRIVVAGESGGANLSIATALQLKLDDDLGLLNGIFVMCPCLDPNLTGPLRPSERENVGIQTAAERTTFIAMAYGIEAAENRNPLAWPGFATVEDLTGLPVTVVNVAECDSLRDEAIEFYRRLLEANVPARCIQLMGVIHAIEIDVVTCPNISREAAMRLAMFAKDPF
jgi:acetyl esterase